MTPSVFRRIAYLALLLAAMSAAFLLPPSTAAVPGAAFEPQENGSQADLSVSKTGPDTAAAGSNVSYSITVNNGGRDAASNVTLSDPLPRGMTFVSITQNSGPAFSCSTPAVGEGGTVTCTIASFSSGSVASFTLVVNVGSNTEPGTTFTNVATVSANTFDPNEENDSGVAVTTVPAPRTDVSVTKSADSEVATPGGEVSYTITVRNSAGAAAANVEMKDTLPGDLTFVSITQTSGPTFSCSTPAPGAGGTITCTIASLPTNAVAVFRLVAGVPEGTSEGTEYVNSASVSTTTVDVNGENDLSTVAITIVSCRQSPAVTSTADGGPGSLRWAVREACAGSIITFAPNLAGPVILTSAEIPINKNLTIQGPGASKLTVRRSTDDATPNFRIFHVSGSRGTGPSVTISGLTITNGRVAGTSPNGWGGAILNQFGTLTLTEVILRENTADDYGGAIYSRDGTLNLTRSTITGNTATNLGGGGIYLNEAGSANVTESTISNNLTGGDGGGMFAVTTLNLTRSTISGNEARRYGGGIETAGNTRIVNSTVVNNTSDTRGGGVSSSFPSIDNTVQIEGSTISGNSSANGGGLYLEGADNKYSLRNTILSGNTAASAGPDAENHGVLFSQGYNIIGIVLNAGGNYVTQSTDQLGVLNPHLMLDPVTNEPLLADNGGPTMTVLPLPGSPAIDKGNGFGLPTDQRGVTRPVDLNDASYPNAEGGNGSDVGAVEVNYSISATAGTPQSAFPGTDFAPLQATLTESGRPVAGVTITFNAPSSGASGTFPSGNTAVTDAQGRASVAFRANSTPGSYQVTANVTPPLSPAAVFHLTNLAPGTIQFGAPAYQQNESGGTVTITVTRTGGSAGAVTANYSAANGTAGGGASCSAGVDFVNASGTLFWADGDSSDKSFVVTICNDELSEEDETVNFSLSIASGHATMGPQSSAVLTIKDDDPAGGVFEFSQETFGVAERGGQRSGIAVRRTGDTTRAASVDYATEDGSSSSVFVPCSATTGIALERCDYTRASGTLHFAAGEALKSFTVLVSDDSFVEGPERTRLVLSNPTGGAVLGAQAAASLEIMDDLEESSANPIDDEEKFVRQHYHDFLNRAPDAAGLKFWTDNINACGADAECRTFKRVDTSAAFFLSIEFQQTGYFVYRTHKAAFGNLPGTPIPVRADEFLHDTQQVSRGVVVGQDGWQAQLESRKAAFALAFVRRPEFLAEYPAGTSATEFVNKLDANAGGVLTQDQKAALVGELSPDPSDETRRASVLRKVTENAAFESAEKNRAFVLMQYFGYLRRNPDDAPDSNFDGYHFWLSKLNQFGGDFRRAEMVRAFISSSEYRSRFGQP